MPLISTPYPQVMNGLFGPDARQPVFLVFYSAVIPATGQMWCPDCRDVEATVKETFDRADKPKAIIVWLEREDWRRPDNEARIKWNVQNIPTILRLEDGKETGRLVESAILDATRLKSFVGGN
ncbi:hypothetical protein NliqN6_1826 [Naganishia liquefaciens]|uniref:Thioredoxin domain-containing protein n=1 Tax=Naganishia liquefaciens TaxID=104408 RepID=A0A8H3TR35_9TREE|nr:hypothetical protein NliqN6_1826 [Naganishia liquefaciens]